VDTIKSVPTYRGVNLQCGAIMRRRDTRLSDAVCSVACLEWGLRMGESGVLMPRPWLNVLLLPEIFPAKEAKKAVGAVVENT